MKSLKTLILSLLVISSLSAAEPYVEAKVGYFFFTDSKMRHVYNNGGIDLQLSATYPLCYQMCDWTLNAYGAIEYFHCSGRSLNDHQKTSVWATPINIGIKPTYTLNDQLDYYFAIGPRYLNLHQHNYSSFVYKKNSKSTLGFFVNTGINYRLCNNFLLDFFVEYTYAKLRFHGGSRVYTRNIQVGGFTLGAGLGYEF